MKRFRRNAIWLPRIAWLLLSVFAIDVAMASACCPLTADSAPVELATPDGAGCPQADGSTTHANHGTCCLSCVVMLSASQFPASTTLYRPAYPQLVYASPIGAVSPPYRPPIPPLA